MSSITPKTDTRPPMSQFFPQAPTSTPTASASLATIIDITVPLTESLPVWPGDPPIHIRKTLELANGEPADVSHINCGSHAGTHVDAFSHFKPDGKSLKDMNLHPYIGKALVVDIED